MTFKIYAVFDTAVGAYMQPFFLRSKGEAIRGWLDAVNDDKTQFNKHPKDFTLFEIGEYDEETGNVQGYPAKIACGTALELLSKNMEKSATPLRGSNGLHSLNDLATAKSIHNL